MKMSPECPAVVRPSENYFCWMLQAERAGGDEEICSICPELRRRLAELPGLDRALKFAAEAHGTQTRKGTDIPYLIHLIRTWDYVRRMTGDPEEQAAALLHDVLEDTPVTFDQLCRAFGSRIAALVAGESECKRKGSPAGETWMIRKQETIHPLRDRLGNEGDRAAMHIALGDKLANLYSMAYEYRDSGECLWEKFNQKDKSMHGWYYGEMGRVFADYFQGSREYGMVEEYQVYYREVFGQYEVSGS